MRPINLHATNFRSYESLALDLGHVSAATLCGENGAGKSSVLKAVIFALFGPEPGVTADDYIKAGTDSMSVTYEFALDEEVYLVERARWFAGARGKSTLEFRRRSGMTWLPLSGATISETQEQINSTLKLDMNGFRMSSWVGQGDAGAFTEARPSERKRVLFDVLGLAIYDDLARMAKDEFHAVQSALAVCLGQIEQLRPHIEELVAVTETEDLAVAREADARAALADGEAELEDARAARAQVAGSADRLVEAQKRLGDAQGRKYKWKAHYDDLDGKILASERQIEKLPELQRRKERLGELRKLDASYSIMRSDLAEAKIAQSKLEMGMARRNAAVEKSDNARADITARTEGIQARRRKLEETAASIEDGKPCPICQRPFDSGGSAAAAHAHVAAEHGELDAEAALLESDRARVARESQDAGTALAQARAAFDAFALPDYPALAHADAISERNDLHGAEDELADARNAEARLLGWQQQRETAGQQLREAQNEADRATSLIDLAQREADEFAAAAALVEACTISRDRRAASLELAIGDRARARERMRECREAKEATAALQEGRREAEESANIWALLAQAFGKDGIPALLVDSAIPELEAEANASLFDLDTGLTVALETQKMLKSKDKMAETLDVIISDDGYERPYESYSGGEAYRVNLALRLALSKMLTHRSGATMQTLILDEPEGLDAAGRSHVIDLLQALEGTFATILLITHHTDMWDAFPVRIECIKTLEGSTATIVE